MLQDEPSLAIVGVDTAEFWPAERCLPRLAGGRGERAGRGGAAPADGLLPRAATVGRRPGGQKPGDDGALDGA